ncbi:hypothetical protein Nhal_1373 [Nitrosococcus halophilus Nc 4]|uniref:Uncharacterized protein n=1 Tax=Nitrosococcus halophilus (strain Nc4) TaxID=472759 RepID=D5C0W7_NITHN|nr:hypothetical protein [Nitrosococcus halophilus]ADE14524.1 hypothetical protein Nhal_1373 [Nitrosococcus halophilus Nc 4]
MAILVLKDLPEARELSPEARAAVVGGFQLPSLSLSERMQAHPLWPLTPSPEVVPMSTNRETQSRTQHHSLSNTVSQTLSY